jgi:PAS domain S-box-containing protein
MSKPVIVCIDDERTILDSLKIELKKILGPEYLIETAEDGQEALELIETLVAQQYTIPLVICDYFMPKLTGSEVLRQVQELSPETLKIMLTGHADFEAVIDTIRQARLYRYIAKPWQAEDLRLTVLEAVHSYQQQQIVSEQNRALEQLTQQQAELIQKLQASETKTRAIVMAAADGIITVDTQGKIQMVNYAVETMFGYMQDELIEQNIAMLMPNAIANQHDHYMQKYLNTGKKNIIGVTREVEGQRKNGEVFPLELSVREVYFGSGRLFVGILHDITKRKQDEAILRLTQYSINHAADSILWVNEQGYVLYANDTAAIRLGYTQQELLSKTIYDIDNYINSLYWRDHWEDLLLNNSLSFESVHKTKLAQIFPVEVVINYLEYDHKCYALIFARDITERKQAEEERLRNAYEIFRLNKAYERFVPSAFLSLLDKSSILEVELGDQVRKEMTVLFSDIRGFTPLSESMSSKRIFNFLNNYLGRMEPIILEHQGVIDKYIGDAIMALFPKQADDGLRGSIAMLRNLREYNQILQAEGLPIINIGIGLNTGSVILGTIGGKNRMEGTVISDTVNLAARVENLTKIYGSELLITEHTYVRLLDPSLYCIRVLDSTKVRGKSRAVTVYEVYDADDEQIITLKNQTLIDFRAGFVLYHSGELERAAQAFQAVLNINPDDKAAQVYLNRIQEQIKTRII